NRCLRLGRLAFLDRLGLGGGNFGRLRAFRLLGRLDVRLDRLARFRLILFVFGFAHEFVSARWLRTVRMRAISRFASFSRAVFSSAPVTDWKRKLKSSWRRSCSASSSWSSLMSRRSLAFKEIGLPLHDLGLH